MTDSRDRTKKGPQQRQRGDVQALLDAVLAGDDQALARLLAIGLTSDEQKLVRLYRLLDATQKAGVHGLIDGFMQANPPMDPKRFQGPVGQMSSCH